VETGCRGDQGSPRAVAPSGRKEGRKDGRKEGRKEGIILTMTACMIYRQTAYMKSQNAGQVSIKPDIVEVLLNFKYTLQF
jgi:hypothetical protein